MHTHAHAGENTAATARVLRLSLLLTAAYILLLLVAGIRAHSLALLSEAGHNLSDFLALGLSLAAVYLEGRPPSATKTYGWRRAGVLAALVNAASLVIISFLIFYESFLRLRDPGHVHPITIIWVAATGVLLNGAIAALLYRSSRDVNIRSAFLHMLGDTLATAAVIGGGIAMMMTSQYWIDAALSVGIGALILWSSFGILRETLNILLEGTPRGMTLAKIERTILSVGGVNYVHDLHVWSIGSETHALSCHVGIADLPLSASDAILREINERLRHDLGISHTTIQFEHEACCEATDGCVMPAGETHDHAH